MQIIMNNVFIQNSNNSKMINNWYASNIYIDDMDDISFQFGSINTNYIFAGIRSIHLVDDPL